MPTSEVFNEDCMEVMARYPDKYFDLAVVDPPYGGANTEEESSGLLGGVGDWEDKPRGRFGGLFDKYAISASPITASRTGGTWAVKYQSKINTWDIAPPQEYFNELARV